VTTQVGVSCTKFTTSQRDKVTPAFVRRKSTTTRSSSVMRVCHGESMLLKEIIKTREESEEGGKVK
jgi:hypothetical protein